MKKTKRTNHPRKSRTQDGPLTGEAPKRWPLFGVERDQTGVRLFVIAQNERDALDKAQTIWSRSNLFLPTETRIKRLGTVDYIPALSADHWEF